MRPITSIQTKPTFFYSSAQSREEDTYFTREDWQNLANGANNNDVTYTDEITRRLFKMESLFSSFWESSGNDRKQYAQELRDAKTAFRQYVAENTLEKEDDITEEPKKRGGFKFPWQR